MRFTRTERKIRELNEHLKRLLSSKNVNDFETNFAAFLASGRSVTLALQTDGNISFDKDGELKKRGIIQGFADWYVEKQKEMRVDELCKYFKDTRDIDLHTGNTAIRSNYHLTATLSTPPNASIGIGLRGTFLIYNKNTPEEYTEQMPLPGKEKFEIGLINTPRTHRGIAIIDRSPTNLCKLFKDYMEDLLKEAKQHFLSL